MTETNQVELDTDEVKEETLHLAEKPKEEKPEKVEVDLGYTDPIKTETKAKVVEEEEPAKDDNLQDVSENVQKRIDKLTRKYREAERRETAALDYAKGLQNKYAGLEKKVQETDKTYVEEYEARVDSQREQVKNRLQKAIEENNSEAIMKANDELTQLAVEKEKAKIKKSQFEEASAQAKAQVEQQAQQPTQQQAQPPSRKAEKWADDNDWFGNDRVMTSAAYAIHEDLVTQGFDPESDEYYNEIDKHMKDNFPHKFNKDKRPVQTVASAGRKQEGRRTVKLTRSQVAIAKKLGVPLEEYAKFVKE
jgi:chromosome segregation ATPase